MLPGISTAFYALIVKSKIKEAGFKDFDTVYYSNLLSIPILLCLSLLTESSAFYQFTDTYFGSSSSSYSSSNSSNGNMTELIWLVMGILVSGVSGFAISFGSSWCVRVTTSTTYR